MLTYTTSSKMVFDDQFYGSDSHENFLKIAKELVDNDIEIDVEMLIDDDAGLMGQCKITLTSEKLMTERDMRLNVRNLEAAINVLNLLEMA